ncbi:MAG: 2-dehydropantoate 2-reductase [Betaproteobacteria bacterium]
MTLRIAVMGVGGIGGCVGGRLAAAGADVLFLARGRHLDALRGDGLHLTSALGNVHLPRINARDSAQGQAPGDFVIFAVKGPDTASAAELIAPIVGPGTAIVTFQNGVEGIDILQARFGHRAVLPGITYIAATVEAPGRIVHVGSGNRSLIGEVDGRRSARTAAFSAISRSAGLGMEISDDILADLWGKFALLAPFAGVACLSRLPVDVWTRIPESMELFLEGMREIFAIARAKGMTLDEAGLIARSIAFLQTLAPGWKGSMLNDLERGRRIEIDSLSGYVHRAGRELGVATPFHSTAYRALRYYAQEHPSTGFRAQA